MLLTSIYVYAYTHMYALTISEKKIINLKESGKQYGVGVGERKEKREM